MSTGVQVDSDGQAMLGWVWMRFVVYAVCGEVALVKWYLWVQFFALGSTAVRAARRVVVVDAVARLPVLLGVVALLVLRWAS